MRKVLLLITILSMFQLFSRGDYETFDEMLRAELKGTVPYIQTNNLSSALRSEDVIYLLDIRTEEEFVTSRIKGAEYYNYKRFRISDVAHIPKNAKVIVYCSVGVRSEMVGEVLMNNGYKNVFNLYGGIFKWINEEREVINNLGKTNYIHGYSKFWSKWIRAGEIVY